MARTAALFAKNSKSFTAEIGNSINFTAFSEDTYDNWVAACNEINTPYNIGGDEEHHMLSGHTDSVLFPGQCADSVYWYMDCYKTNGRQGVFLQVAEDGSKALFRTWNAGNVSDWIDLSLELPLSISNGGTGASTAVNALDNLGVYKNTDVEPTAYPDKGGIYKIDGQHIFAGANHPDNYHGTLLIYGEGYTWHIYIADGVIWYGGSEDTISEPSEWYNTLRSDTVDFYLKNIYLIGSKSTQSAIRLIDNTTDNTGNGMSIGAGGATVIGGGESAVTMSEELETHGGREYMYICNDTQIDFYTNCQGGAESATHSYLTSGGNLVLAESQANHLVFGGGSLYSYIDSRAEDNTTVKSNLVFYDGYVQTNKRFNALGGLTEVIRKYGDDGTTPDLNDITVTGRYYVRNGTNRPTGENGYLEVIYYSSDFIYQEYTTYTNRKYTRTKQFGTWRDWFTVPITKYGTVSITPVVNRPTSAHVDFGVTFPFAPNVQLTMRSVAPGTEVTGIGVSNITTTGCDVYVTRTNTNATTILWMAIC